MPLAAANAMSVYEAQAAAFIDLEVPTYIDSLEIELRDAYGFEHKLNGHVPTLTLCCTLDERPR